MGEKSTKKNVLSGISWSFAERLSAQLVSFIVSIVLARILMPDDYGIVAIVMVFINICDAFVIGGFGNSLVHKKDADELDFDSICWISIFVALGLYAILFFTAPFIAGACKMPGISVMLRVMGIRFIITSFNSIQQAYVQKKMAFRKFFYATFGGTMLSAVIGIGMAYAGFGAWALVAQYMSSSVIGTVILFIVCDWRLKFRISMERVRSLWSYGYKVMLSTMTAVFKDNIRTFIIGLKFTTADLAYYDQGRKYPAILVNDVVDSIGKVMFPVFSREQNERLLVKNHMRKSVKISAFVLSPLIIGLIGIADTFVSVILTEKWMGCVPFLRILALVYITRSLNTIFQKALLAIGKSNQNLIHEVITSVLTVVIIILAVFAFKSLELIAWSYVLVSLVGTAIFSYFSHREFNYRYHEMMLDFLPSVLISAAMGVAVYAVQFIPMSGVLTLILQIATGFISYLALTFIFERKMLIQLMDMLKSFFNKKKNARSSTDV